VNRRFCLLFCLVSCAAAQDIFAAQPLGRLFYTPEERARMEKTQDTPKTAEATPRYDGVVESSAGRRTVWVDGQPRETPETPDFQSVGGAPEELLRGGRIVAHPEK
jgi:hypothetical protein